MFQNVGHRRSRFRFVEPAFFGFRRSVLTTTNHAVVATTATDVDEHFGTDF